jgi:hypothetical protein
MEFEEEKGANARPLVIRGRAIRADENGLVCLNDIWRAAGFSTNQRPADWGALPSTLKRIERVLKLITGKSGNYVKADILRVLKTRVGKNGGTWTDIRLALDYAEYLNPALAIEVKEVFLRYKAADPTLADDIMDRASAEANEWMAKRALSRSARLGYTATLNKHGVTERQHYAECTNATYRSLFGKGAKQLKSDKGVPAKGSLRDSMNIQELVTVSFTEVMSSDRIEDTQSYGFIECRNATVKVATAVRCMIEGDRKDRQKRLHWSDPENPE